MKKINSFLLLAVLICTASSLIAQSSVQMPKWPLNGKEVDFVNNQVNSTDASLSTPKYVSNGYYNRNHDLLFHIIDNNLWWGNGTWAGPLFEDVDPIEWPDDIYPEIIVVPRDTLYCEEGSFYTFYALRQYAQDTNLRYECPMVYYTLNSNIISPTEHGGTYTAAHQEYLLDSLPCLSAIMGIAATDFLPGTNTRRLYLVTFNEDTYMSQIVFFNVSPNAITGPYTVSSVYGQNNPFEPCEVEISKDNSKLVFTRNKAFGYVGYSNTNDVTIVHLHPSSGYRNTSLGTNGYTYVDLGPTNSRYDHYVGVEFSANLADLYVTQAGVGLHRYNFGTQIGTQISGTDSIANSQLEMGRDGYIYGMNGNGQLYKISSSGVFSTSGYNIGTSGVINNKIYDCLGCTTPPRQVYTIPEQIDGYDYDSLWGNAEICCYPWNESKFLTPMTGVSENGDDIVITGSNVVWNTSLNPFNQSTDIYMKGNLIIQPGAKLTITGLTLHFKENQKVQLNQNAAGNFKGAYLYLNNSKLTAFEVCDETSMWLGVEANGAGSSYVQIPFSNTKQPQVEMRNGSVIEYAEAGINAQNGSFVRSYSGCSFKDNIVDVHITNFSPQNYSQFYETAFYTTQVLYDQKNVAPTIHAHIWTAQGVQFKGCSFRNDATSIPSLSARGSGILSDYSHISVKNNNSVRGEFENLWYGIKANGGASAILTECDFGENLGGAWFINNNALSVTKCDFNVGNTSYYSTTYFETYGLYIESCTGYQIEENVFHDGLLGMVVFNSGYANNRIYKNDFYNINLDTYSIILPENWTTG